MTQAIRIGTRHYAPYVAARLTSGIARLERGGIAQAYISQHEKGGMTFFSIDFPGRLWLSPEKVEDVFRFVSEIIADLVVGDIHAFVFEKMAGDGYPGLDEEERSHICRRALRSFWVQAAGGTDGGTALDEDMEGVKSKVRARVYERALEYMRTNNEIIVEGFLRFRLKDQVSMMAEMLDQAVEDYLVEKEYREFIRLLRYFVEIQEPRTPVVHIIGLPGGSYRLLDQDDQEMKGEYLGEILKEPLDGLSSGDDLLLSALITMAPARIILHLDAGGQLAETIRVVFEDRVEVCPGCPRCHAGTFKSFPIT